jgi:small subunit ribosomal protein S18
MSDENEYRESGEETSSDTTSSRPRRDRRPQGGSRNRRPSGRGRRSTSGCGPRCVGYKGSPINYRLIDVMKRYVTDRGKIRPRRQTGNCAKHQRVLAREIKRARYMALLPFTSEHIFPSGG